MGRHRETKDDALYEKRRGYYLKHKERIAARSREWYKRTDTVFSQVRKAVSEELKLERLRERRRKSGRTPFTIYETAQQFIRDFKKGLACLDCDKVYPSFVMEFDHVRGEKVADVSALVAKGVPESMLRAEIEKCDLVCANCHRIRTFHRRGMFL